MALALDGSVHDVGVSTVNLTTVAADCLIVLVVTINHATVTGVSSANTTGWALRKRQDVGDSNFVIEEWAGVAANPLSGETITVTFNTAPSFMTIDAFGISGADTTTKFDSNGALPDGQSGANLCSITTDNADCFLLGAYRFGGTGSPTEGAGWTIISGANNQLTEYKIVSAPQSGLSVTIGTGNGDQNAGIGEAFIQAAGGGARRLILSSPLA